MRTPARPEMKRLCLAALACALLALGPAAGAGNLQVAVTDKEGKPVQDAVVVLLPTGTALPRVPLPQRPVINQEKMRFVPALTLVTAGTRILFVNNDPWEHHVRASAAGVMQFDAAQAGGFELRLDGKVEGKEGKSAEAFFDKPGAVLLGCHLHASMRGHVYVAESPWAMITDADGLASFEGVPDGATKVKVWHSEQLLDIPVRQVVLTPAPAKTGMQLSVVPRRRRI
jgi:plastocyanin